MPTWIVALTRARLRKSVEPLLTNRMIIDDISLAANKVAPRVRFTPLRQPVCTFYLHFGEGQKLRAKCGVLSARSAPERAGSRRIRPIWRALSPCEVKTVRVSA